MGQVITKSYIKHLLNNGKVPYYHRGIQKREIAKSKDKEVKK